METPSTQQEKTKYSDEELQMFKELILKKIEEAKRNLELLNQAVAGSENDVRDTSHTIMTIDDGQEVLAKEENSKLAARQMRFIKDLEAALIRIENRTYGICRITGKLIPKERLMIVPHATTTVEGKNMQNATKKAVAPKPIV
ncbi:MAG: TraR/DksA family transcriptional regulator [Bacteroidales bacterium]|nr:TraR/DksA family transcriptional regulator [Bacteroidales bacterium]